MYRYEWCTIASEAAAVAATVSSDSRMGKPKLIQ